MPQAEKAQKVDQLSDALSKATSVFMTDFTGLSVEDITRLRREMRKAGVKYIVVKNTLARISAEKAGISQMVPYLTGPTGLALSFDDPASPVRIIFDFRKDKEKPAIKAAVIEGELLNQQAAEQIRNIPPRQILLGQVVSAMAAPLSGFIGGLSSIMSKLVYTINAIKEKKES